MKFACGVYVAFWDVVFVCVENDVWERWCLQYVYLVLVECQRKQSPCL